MISFLIHHVLAGSPEAPIDQTSVAALLRHHVPQGREPRNEHPDLATAGEYHLERVLGLGCLDRQRLNLDAQVPVPFLFKERWVCADRWDENRVRSCQDWSAATTGALVSGEGEEVLLLRDVPHVGRSVAGADIPRIRKAIRTVSAGNPNQETPEDGYPARGISCELDGEPLREPVPQRKARGNLGRKQGEVQPID